MQLNLAQIQARNAAFMASAPSNDNAPRAFSFQQYGAMVEALTQWGFEAGRRQLENRAATGDAGAQRILSSLKNGEAHA